MIVNMLTWRWGEIVEQCKREAENVHAVTAWRVKQTDGLNPEQLEGCTKWVEHDGYWVCVEFLDGSKQEVVNNG